LLDIQPDVAAVRDLISLLDPFPGMINLEVKHLFGEQGSARGRICIEKLSELIQRSLGGDERKLARFVISSFSLKNVRIISTELPSVSRAYLVPVGMPLGIALKRSIRFGCSAIHCTTGQLHSRRFGTLVQRAHRSGLKVRVHTINNEAGFTRCREMNVDGIFTDDVAQMSSLN
jgi:glycerophosphoryl diester phosphodiesterase